MCFRDSDFSLKPAVMNSMQKAAWDAYVKCAHTSKHPSSLQHSPWIMSNALLDMISQMWCKTVWLLIIVARDGVIEAVVTVEHQLAS